MSIASLRRAGAKALLFVLFKEVVDMGMTTVVKRMELAASVLRGSILQWDMGKSLTYDDIVYALSDAQVEDLYDERQSLLTELKYAWEFNADEYDSAGDKVYYSLVSDFLRDKVSAERSSGNVGLAEIIAAEGYEMLDFLNGDLLEYDSDAGTVALSEVYSELRSDYEKYAPWAREHAKYFEDDTHDEEGLYERDANDYACYYLDGILRSRERDGLQFFFREADPMRCPEEYLLRSLDLCEKFAEFCTSERISEKVALYP